MLAGLSGGTTSVDPSRSLDWQVSRVRRPGTTRRSTGHRAADYGTSHATPADYQASSGASWRPFERPSRAAEPAKRSPRTSFGFTSRRAAGPLRTRWCIEFLCPLRGRARAHEGGMIRRPVDDADSLALVPARTQPVVATPGLSVSGR